MGILANTVSLCQFRVLGALPAADLAPWAGERLARNGFRSIDRSADELSVGWVNLDDPKSGEFENPQVFHRDHYLVFTLRRDQRRLPGALFRAYREEAEKEWLAAHPGLKRVPRQKREELAEAVRGSLFARTLPVPATYDAVWDTRSGLLSFASLSPKVVELFEGIFRQSFEGLRLVAIHPYARAAELAGEALRPALEKANRATGETVLELIEANLWLGEEFLLWLLYRSLNGASDYGVCRPGPSLEGEGFTAFLDDRLVLLGGGEAGVQKVTVAGPQDSFSETRAALSGGKRITEAVIHLEKGEDRWQLTLKGGVFQFASFKAPKVKLEKDDLTDPTREREAVFFERMGLLETGLQLFDSLFATFLDLRLCSSWGTEQKQIDAWLAED